MDDDETTVAAETWDTKAARVMAVAAAPAKVRATLMVSMTYLSFGIDTARSLSCASADAPLPGPSSYLPTASAPVFESKVRAAASMILAISQTISI